MPRMRLPLIATLVLLMLPGGVTAEPKLLARLSVYKPVTWDSPLVPRLTAGSLPGDNLTTAPLLAPTSPVWLNWAVSTNPAVNGVWIDQLELDGVPYQLLPRRKQAFVSQNWFAMDAGPFFVRGGRHTVRATTDIANRIEDYEFRGDNQANRQLVWTPEPLAASPGAIYSLDGPPLPVTEGAQFANNHAYSLATPSQPWAVASSATLDYDLTLFDDFTSSTNGLLHAVASSSRTQDSLDVIVSGGVGLPATVYPAVMRKPGAGDAQYFVDWNDASGHLDTDGDAFWGAESLNASRVVNLYPIDLQAGVLYPMSLWTLVGSDPIHFAMFPATPSFVGSLAQALVRSQPVPGQDYEIATFTPATSGRYLILAFREHSSYTLERYQLAVGSQAVSVGGEPQGAPWLSAAPNPSRSEARLSYTLAEATRVKLDVLDLQGRLVDTVLDGPRAAGTHVESWDLRNADGAPVAPGLYWVRLDLGARRRLTRLSVIR